jgi:argininosuccinate lyase
MSETYLFDSGRLHEPAAAAIKAFTAQNTSIERMQEELDWGVWVDLAHVLMLYEQNILPRDSAAALLHTLQDIQHKGAAAFPIKAERGGTYAQIEGYLLETLGNAIGGQLHIGRSRIDRRATMSRLAARGVLLNVLPALLKLQSVLLELGERHAATIMPGYTHLQHAQPTTFGHYLSGYGERLLRDLARLQEAFKRLNQCPLGAAALAGSGWPLDRLRTALLLGFDQPLRSARDGGEFYKEYNLEILSDLAILSITLGHLANELYLWHSQEFDLISLGDAYTATSSMMPQKRNPHALDIIKSLCAYVSGLPAADFALHRMCTATDLDATFSRSGIHSGGEKITQALTIFSGALGSLTLNSVRMRQQAGAHWATTINLADRLCAEHGLAFRDSHRVCGRVVQLALSRALTPATITAAVVAEATQAVLGQPLVVSDAWVREALAVERFIHSRTTQGGTAPDEVRRVLALQRQEIHTHHVWLEAVHTRLQQAEQTLAAGIAKVHS